MTNGSSCKYLVTLLLLHCPGGNESVFFSSALHFIGYSVIPLFQRAIQNLYLTVLERTQTDFIWKDLFEALKNTIGGCLVEMLSECDLGFFVVFSPREYKIDDSYNI